MLTFCSLEDITKAASFGGRYDNILQDVIDGVTEKFNTFLNRNLELVVGHSELFNTPYLKYGASTTIWLEKKNILAGSVVLNLSTTRSFADELAVLMEAASYKVDHARGRITLYGFIPRAIDGLKVTYTGGYPEIDDTGVMDCPAVLRGAATEQVLFEANRRVNSFGASSGAADDDNNGPKLTAYGLLPHLQADIIPYRRSLGG